MENRNVNRESEFKILVTVSEQLAGIPFRFTFFTANDKKKTYVAEKNGEIEKNVVMASDTQIIIPFDNYDLPCGKLLVRKEFFKIDGQMPDGELHYVSVEPVIDKSINIDGMFIVLGNGKTDNEDFNVDAEFFTNVFHIFAKPEWDD